MRLLGCQIAPLPSRLSSDDAAATAMKDAGEAPIVEIIDAFWESVAVSTMC